MECASQPGTASRSCGYQLYLPKYIQHNTQYTVTISEESEHTWPIDHILSHRICACWPFDTQLADSIERKKKAAIRKIIYGENVKRKKKSDWMTRRRVARRRRRREDTHNMLNAWMMESIQKATRSRTVRSKLLSGASRHSLSCTFDKKKKNWEKKNDRSSETRSGKRTTKATVVCAYWSLDARSAAEKSQKKAEKMLLPCLFKWHSSSGCTERERAMWTQSKLFPVVEIGNLTFIMNELGTNLKSHGSSFKKSEKSVLIDRISSLWGWRRRL